MNSKCYHRSGEQEFQQGQHDGDSFHGKKSRSNLSSETSFLSLDRGNAASASKTDVNHYSKLNTSNSVSRNNSLHQNRIISHQSPNKKGRRKGLEGKGLSPGTGETEKRTGKTPLLSPSPTLTFSGKKSIGKRNRNLITVIVKKNETIIITNLKVTLETIEGH